MGDRTPSRRRPRCARLLWAGISRFPGPRAGLGAALALGLFATPCRAVCTVVPTPGYLQTGARGTVGVAWALPGQRLDAYAPPPGCAGAMAGAPAEPALALVYPPLQGREPALVVGSADCGAVGLEPCGPGIRTTCLPARSLGLKHLASAPTGSWGLRYEHPGGVCEGGAREGLPCTGSGQCGGGVSCELAGRRPPVGGPAALAVFLEGPVPDSLCELAEGTLDCAATPAAELPICVDDFRERDPSSGCALSAAAKGSFSGFVVLPAPNDFREECSSSNTSPFCRGAADDKRLVLALDRAGNAMIPFSWRRIRGPAHAGRARWVRGHTAARRARGLPGPIALPPGARPQDWLEVYTPKGGRVPLVVQPRKISTGELSLEATADADASILLVRRRSGGKGPIFDLSDRVDPKRGTVTLWDRMGPETPACDPLACRAAGGRCVGGFCRGVRLDARHWRSAYHFARGAGFTAEALPASLAGFAPGGIGAGLRLSLRDDRTGALVEPCPGETGEPASAPVGRVALPDGRPSMPLLAVASRPAGRGGFVATLGPAGPDGARPLHRFAVEDRDDAEEPRHVCARATAALSVPSVSMDRAVDGWPLAVTPDGLALFRTAPPGGELVVVGLAGQAEVRGPAEQVVSTSGGVAWLAGPPDLAGAGRVRLLAVDALDRPVDLELRATAIALAGPALAALVPEAGPKGLPGCDAEGARDLNGDGDCGDAVLHVARVDWSAPGVGPWINLGRSATEAAWLDGALVYLRSEEMDGIDGNGDGDRLDRLLEVRLAVLPDGVAGAPGPVVETGLAAGDFVLPDPDPATRAADCRVVAFDVVESEQGISLNGPPGAGDRLDRVMHVLDLAAAEAAAAAGLAPLEAGARATRNLARAMRPCRALHCDPRRPYRVFGRHLHFRGDECDGDGDDFPGVCSDPGGGTDATRDGVADRQVEHAVRVCPDPVFLEALADLEAEARHALEGLAAERTAAIRALLEAGLDRRREEHFEASVRAVFPGSRVLGLAGTCASPVEDSFVEPGPPPGRERRTVCRAGLLPVDEKRCRAVAGPCLSDRDCEDAGAGFTCEQSLSVLLFAPVEDGEGAGDAIR